MTERVCQRLRDRYEFGERGLVEVKGIGPTRAYLLVGRRDG